MTHFEKIYKYDHPFVFFGTDSKNRGNKSPEIVSLNFEILFSKRSDTSKFLRKFNERFANYGIVRSILKYKKRLCLQFIFIY